jgi:periplasmic copper chaperone A
MSSIRAVVSLFIAATGLALAPPVNAQVTVANPWVRGTVAGQKGTGAFMQLTSVVDITLVDAASPAAKIVEIHEMKIDGGMMKMKAVDRLPLPAGQPVELRPGGYHVMLMDLPAPLKAGDVVPVTLTFEDKAGRKTTLVVNAPVRALTAGAMPAPRQ